MFEKLLSVIPYSPGLIGQMAFYSRRMREEATIRRTGTVFLTLAFVVQFFAVLSPPQTSLADRDNSLISGGIGSAADAKNACVNNIRHYQDVMKHFGITCKAIGEAPTSTIHSDARDYYSMGWVAYGDKLPGSNETPINIENVGIPLYIRKLSSWDTNGTSTYQALHVLNSDGKNFYILFNCGNLVMIGLPIPVYNVPDLPAQPQPVAPTQTPSPTPTPQPTPTPTPPVSPPTTPPCDKDISGTNPLACVSYHKKAANITANKPDANNTVAQPGDIIVYTISASNSGKAAVTGFVFHESLSDVLDYADVTDLHGGKIDNYNEVSWSAESIGPEQTVSHQVTVKVKDPVPSTPNDPNNPNRFDLDMLNVYGDTVSIKVPGTPTKQAEVAAASLPNTGPGTSLFIAGAIVMIAAYFYSRAGLLARESEIAVKEASAV
jgi:uncharacterized repeat protein (TIGR01451 family)